jgi:hypothetical protein
MFLLGRVAIGDGTPVPNDVLVERVCNGRVSQQVYAAPRGGFSMQLGSMADTFLDASGDRNSPYGTVRKDPVAGMSRRDLVNCELRASVPGFHSAVISLMNLTPSGSTIDVGVISVQRSTKIEGMTVSATLQSAERC